VSERYILLLVIALTLSLPACAGTEASSSGGAGTTDAERTEQSEPRSGDKRDDQSGSGAGERGRREGRGDREIQSAVLELTGDEGAGFSGVCTVGDEKVEVEGTVPRSLDLDLNGEALRCEIEKTGEGTLKADLVVGNSHYIQQTTTQGSTLNFALSGDGYSSSTSSVTAIESKTPDAVSNASSHVEVR
jgi:hypothetical protein